MIGSKFYYGYIEIHTSKTFANEATSIMKIFDANLRGSGQGKIYSVCGVAAAELRAGNLILSPSHARAAFNNFS